MSPPQPLLPPAAMSPPQPLLPPTALVVVVLVAVAEADDVVVCWFALAVRLVNWSRAKARIFSTVKKGQSVCQLFE